MKIRTSTIYICEYCGEEFKEDYKELAERHEAIEKLLSECRFWLCDMTEMKLVTLGENPNAVYCFYAPDVQHAIAIATWFENWELDFPADIPTGGTWLYDNNTENWLPLSDLKSKRNKIESLAV